MLLIALECTFYIAGVSVMRSQIVKDAAFPNRGKHCPCVEMCTRGIRIDINSINHKWYSQFEIQRIK